MSKSRNKKPYLFVDKQGYFRLPSHLVGVHSRPCETYCVEFKTYRQLLKELPSLFKETGKQVITIYRTRRGEWGEWFEKWTTTAKGDLSLIKQGWL